jgi:hypothetical protein
MRFRLSSAEEIQAHEVHRAAATWSLLILSWGAIAFAVVPSEPFWVANLAEVLLGAAGLVYLLWTWNRPRRRVAEGIFAILFVYAVLVLPWTFVVWCRLGRPVEAFVVPQVGIISIALLFPGRWSFGAAAMSLFVAESLAVFVYARHVGLHELIPITEPFATAGITILGIGLLILRRHRRDLARKHVRARAEIEALDRIRPVIVHARTELEAQVAVLVSEVLANGGNAADVRSTRISRALERLGDLGRKLGALVVDEAAAPPQVAERQLLERDAQLGAILLAGLAAALTLLAALFSHVRFGQVPASVLAAIAVEFAILLYLLRTRRRSSSRRALWAVLALFTMALALVTYNQFWMLRENLPFAPFLGHKLLMVVLGMALATRFRLGVVLIVATAVNAIALWFALDLGAHRHIVSVSEPWATLTFTLISLVSLRVLEQRQIASVELLRDEAAVSAMQRRASMFLALRDRLNSPLQTLVISATRASSHLPPSDTKRVQAAVDRLVALSRELAELDVRLPRPSAAFDTNHELSRRA